MLKKYKMANKNRFIKIISLMLITIFAIISVNASANFTLNTSSIVENLNISTTYSNSIRVTNTGNKTLNLTITKVDLKNGTKTIPLNLDKTSISNLSPGNFSDILVNLTTGTDTGNYSGLINVSNTENNSLSKIVIYHISVINSSSNNSSSSNTTENNTNSNETTSESVSFLDFPGTLTMNISVDDSSDRAIFYLVNNENKSITNVSFDLSSRFEGSDDNIDDNDFEINGEKGYDTYDYNDDWDLKSISPGSKYKLTLDLDIPSHLDTGNYWGKIIVSYTLNGKKYTKAFTLKIIATSDQSDTEIEQNSAYVRNGILKVTVDEGESINDIYFKVENNEGYDEKDLRVALDGDLREVDTGKIMDKSVVSFNPDTFDLFENDEKNIYVKINLPENQTSGTYTANIKLYSSSGEVLDKIELDIQVIGDVYIKSINYNNNVKPGDYVDVNVDIVNNVGTIQRNVKVSGTLFSFGSTESDIYEDSPTFLLEGNSEKIETLRFDIPDDELDGSHTLQIEVMYGDQQIFKVVNLNVVRPSHKIDIESSNINPVNAKCDDSNLYTYLKIKNLGKYDENVRITTEIKGTGISKESNEIDLDVNEETEKTANLDISNLKPGTYEVDQIVHYANVFETTSKRTLTIENCSTNNLNLKTINETVLNNYNESSQNLNNTVNIFGENINETTAYLGAGVGIVFILIIVLLLLIWKNFNLIQIFIKIYKWILF